MSTGSGKMCIAAVFLMACGAWGATTTAPPVDPAVAAFISDTTLGVARFEPAGIDMNAVQVRQEKLIRDSLTPGTANMLLPQYQQGMSFLRQWLVEFQKAGGKVMYCVVFMHLSIGQDSANPVGAVLVVPLESGANAKALASLFVNGEPSGPDHRFYGNGNAPKNAVQNGVEALVFNHAVVYGEIDAVEKAKTIKPLPRAALTAAIGAAGDGPLTGAFAPTFPFRMMAGAVATQMPTFPAGTASGVPTAALINGLNWASVSLSPPPRPSLRLIAQCKDAGAARVWADGIDALLEEFRQMPQNMDVMDDQEATVEAMRPSLRGDQLVWNLNEEQLVTINRAWIPIIVGDQRPVAPSNAQISMSNERQIVMAIILFADSHGGKLPDKLAELAPFAGGNKALNSLLTSPFDTSKSPGYVYVKPAEKISQVTKPAETVILYDAAAPPNGVLAVGYLDGHVQRIPQAQLKTLIAKKP